MQSGLLSLTFDIALSHWCIFNRSYAEQIVATWKIQFDKSDIIHKIALLHLANDILQNSKRNGNEFVIEFWKVLPAALKDVIAENNPRGERAVSRL
ncbi:regulation of nuclear pre-mRNA domain-containing protein 1B-like, partial [Trifolium medium]|nr:regulation of nuclear pre-mRNA domain-containing protein 1B-like [Trifolium medium]